ncbi:hypothetical protein XENOCAPTIV_007466 [Xenoophorus captivus]|uniref:Ig-like domain-containing protein n=1 Tax=Xenoophorus captivus TaxID=1517983 RepID=A0ABV0SET5_9TELE
MLFLERIYNWLWPTIYTWEKAEGELPPLAKADGAILSFLMLNKSDNGVYTCHADNGIGKGRGSYMLQVQDTTAMSTSSGVDHAVIGGVVAVIVFILLCLLIVLGRYLIRHKGQQPCTNKPKPTLMHSCMNIRKDTLAYIWIHAKIQLRIIPHIHECKEILHARMCKCDFELYISIRTP